MEWVGPLAWLAEGKDEWMSMLSRKKKLRYQVPYIGQGSLGVADA